MSDIGQTKEDLEIKVLQKEIEIRNKEIILNNLATSRIQAELDRKMIEKRLIEHDNTEKATKQDIEKCKVDLESMKHALSKADSIKS